MKVLFLGEESGRSAEYMREALLYNKHLVTHVDCKEKIPSFKNEKFDVVIISDYPAAGINNKTGKYLKDSVENGTRFIMIGGWASFNGKGNSYFNHPVAEILPVKLKQNDDRINLNQGLFLFPSDKIKKKFPLEWEKPPVICGYNNTTQKNNSTVLVWMKPVSTNGKKISLLDPIPFVIKGLYGKGTTIACVTDLSPHWCGGLVDWGNKRINLNKVEIGNVFIKFVQFLLEA